MRPRPFARRRAAKKLDKQLGNLLWRQAHDRFARSLDRYWQIVDPQRSSAIAQEELNGLVHAGNVLTDAMATVQRICVESRERFGEHDLDVPAGANDIHRLLSRAANDLAATAQAAAMFKRGQASLESVGRRAEKVLESVQAAEHFLDS
jgi:hypothetical protein